MFEFLGLIGIVFLFGVVALVGWILLLPFYFLFRLFGLALKVGFAGIFVVLAGLLLLPIMLLVGAVLLLKLMIIGIPLLIAFALFSWLVGFFRRTPATHVTISTQPVHPG